jgi:hypothetical protein
MLLLLVLSYVSAIVSELLAVLSARWTTYSQVSCNRLGVDRYPL